MIKNLEITKESSATATAAAAGEALNFLLFEHTEQPVLLLLSSGSALAILDYIGPKALSENLTVAMLDERFSVDEKVNNFSQLQKTEFYATAFSVEVNFFGSLPRANETIEQLQQRMEHNLREWKKENPDGLIIATLGLGADGHTAGIMPYPEDAAKFKEMFENDNWITGYDAGNKNQYPKRVTATATFFKHIDIGFVYVCGHAKKEKLDEVLSGDGKLNALPALAWQEIKNVKLFTDISD